MPNLSKSQPGFLRQVHEPTKKFLEEWLDAPAHIHHIAHRMANPPLERPQTRREFQHLLHSLSIPERTTVIQEKFGYGVSTAHNGDRLVITWEAHTEYYSYQVWHIPHDSSQLLEFGPITFPDYVFPFSPLGIAVNALDIIITPNAQVTPQALKLRMPGPQLHGGQVFGDEISVVANFSPDEYGRERYYVCAASRDVLQAKLTNLIDTLVAIENYTHLILLPYQAFSTAVDQVHHFEQRHLYQRNVITNQLETATSETLQKWLTVLTQDFMKVSRLAESMRYKLSAAVPYERIIERNVKTLQEQALPSCRLISDYIHHKTTGVADGYQQLLKRIDALEKDFEGTISVIRTKVDLLLQDQNLALQDQNLKLLASVDKTTKSQAILQHTVEGLSVIVIAYYLSGLGSYVFKALHEAGILDSYSFASGVFVPVSLIMSSGLVFIGRKILNTRLFQEH
ncbi:MAG: DUF3422 domain-containing protein [Nitrospirales bacterium]|nr:DUF3422 family protein [Nitrospira sp.]MDR4499955.1 DUF3422 domain-containing protein [Nitrospirales bacterium]